MLRNPFRLVNRANFCRYFVRQQGTDSTQLTDGEEKILKILKSKFPKAEEVQVHDISGGCGSMYEILISSTEFSGKRTVMQHRMVNDALKEEIKDMHGLRVTTKVPDG